MIEKEALGRTVDYIKRQTENERLYYSKDENLDFAKTVKIALEKQIPYPLKPNKCKGSAIPVCGKCGGIMDLMQGNLNYCPNCGQKLLWAERLNEKAQIADCFNSYNMVVGAHFIDNLLKEMVGEEE